MATFGDRVREQRERNGWTVAQCAEKAGWPWPRWKRIEEDEPKRQNGEPPQLRRETVEKIAEVLRWNKEDALQAAGYLPDEIRIIRIPGSDEPDQRARSGSDVENLNDLTPKEELRQIRTLLERIWQRVADVEENTKE